jgi:hypothetical protein
MPQDSPLPVFRTQVDPPESVSEVSYRARVIRQHSSFVRLGITTKEIEELELGVSTDPECMPGRLLFPVCSAAGRLVGYAGRKLDSHAYSYFGNAEQTVFNLHEVVAFPGVQRVVLVNDPLDVLRVRRHVENVVSLLGSRCLDLQLSRLTYHIPRRPLLVLCDATPAGRKRRLELVRKLSPFHPVYAPEFLENGRTVRSLSPQELEEVL